MWMMGCRDSAGLQTSDAFSGRKLRPLIPRPTTYSSSSTTSVAATTTCFSRIHSNDLFALHNHLGAVEQGKREVCNHPVSSRWNPTPEQLHTLEELYRRGTRTPSAEQIQHITAQLRRYGKIEGKNVFYWFQNHKARERQKRRRQIEAAMALERDAVMESKDSAMSRTEGCKNWSHPTNCSILAEESALLSKAEATMEGGRFQFDRELNHQSSAGRNATWHFHLSSLPHHITTNPVPTTAAATVTTTRTPTLVDEGCNVVAGDEFQQSQTLELFPLRSNGVFLPEKPEQSLMPVAPTTTANFGPYQFFQFL